jgi:hypothetical protein
MGQMEMKCIFDIGKNISFMGQGYSSERCGPLAFCLTGVNNTIFHTNKILGRYLLDLPFTQVQVTQSLPYM